MRYKYFPDLEIAGWVQYQPGHGAYLGYNPYNYHIENFTEKHQVLFVADYTQRVDAFYAYDNTKSLVETKGYFIYQDENENMKRYTNESLKEAQKG